MSGCKVLLCYSDASLIVCRRTTASLLGYEGGRSSATIIILNIVTNHHWIRLHVHATQDSSPKALLRVRHTVRIRVSAHGGGLIYFPAQYLDNRGGANVGEGATKSIVPCRASRTSIFRHPHRSRCRSIGKGNLPHPCARTPTPTATEPQQIRNEEEADVS